MRILLFDIDGTLIDASNAPRRAFCAAFKELFGIEPNFEGVNVHGATDPEIHRNVSFATFNRDLKPNEIAGLRARYIELLYLEIDTEPNYKILPGVEDLLLSLTKRHDVLVGLQTGNIEGAVDAKLGRSNLNQYFTFGGFGTDSYERSQIVTTAIRRAQAIAWDKTFNPSRITVIGDTPQDVKAGIEAGVKTIAVATGVYTTDVLYSERPTHVFPDLSDKDAFYSAVGLS